MALATSLRKTASKVINRFGGDITYRQVSSGTYNTTTGAIVETETDTTIKGVLDTVRKQELNELVHEQDKKLMIAAADLTVTPSLSDRVVISGTVHQIVKINVIEHLEKVGNIAKISDITQALTCSANKLDQARLAFVADLSPNLVVIDDSDTFHHSVGIKKVHDDKSIREHIENIIAAIKKIGQPTDATEIRKHTGHENDKHVSALAAISKQLAHLNNRWGLTKWPLVNPKNIRDKIYVVLKEHGKPMHFSEISQEIRKSVFKRKDVTTQAIHNELIKDKRFVLIGRGIYALDEWGYQKGTVADIIVDVLKKAGEPLHRDEIVKRVLASRQVKETTILLNLQGKSQFKRVAKATYTLA